MPLPLLFYTAPVHIFGLQVKSKNMVKIILEKIFGHFEKKNEMASLLNVKN